MISVDKEKYFCI